MLKKVLILVGALVVVGGAAGGALYYFYPVQVSMFAGLTRNYVLSWSAPPGTMSTELNPAGQGAAAAARRPPPRPCRRNRTARTGRATTGRSTSDRFSPLCGRSIRRMSAS